MLHKLFLKGLGWVSEIPTLWVSSKRGGGLGLVGVSEGGGLHLGPLLSSASISEISQETAVNPVDIVSTLQALQMLKYWKGKHLVLKRQVNSRSAAGSVLHVSWGLAEQNGVLMPEKQPSLLKGVGVHILHTESLSSLSPFFLFLFLVCKEAC